MHKSCYDRWVQEYNLNGCAVVSIVFLLLLENQGPRSWESCFPKLCPKYSSNEVVGTCESHLSSQFVVIKFHSSNFNQSPRY